MAWQAAQKSLHFGAQPGGLRFGGVGALGLDFGFIHSFFCRRQDFSRFWIKNA